MCSSISTLRFLWFPPAPLRILSMHHKTQKLQEVGSWCQLNTFNPVYLIWESSRSHCKKGDWSKIALSESMASRSHPSKARFYKSKDTFWAEKRLTTFGEAMGRLILFSLIPMHCKTRQKWVSIHELHSFQSIQKKSSAVPFACICAHAFPAQLTKTAHQGS